MSDPHAMVLTTALSRDLALVSQALTALREQMQELRQDQKDLRALVFKLVAGAAASGGTLGALAGHLL